MASKRFTTSPDRLNPGTKWTFHLDRFISAAGVKQTCLGRAATSPNGPMRSLKTPYACGHAFRVARFAGLTQSFDNVGISRHHWTRERAMIKVSVMYPNTA